ncbi:ATP-binding protein [Bacteroides helcogenes]|uniref:AAA-ATPase n=1 Tax=Bacteroides helcogenes (strain ATCC 35417 / DSM 20613 / JCM 6297 / CCUG 15421 / P 36-108) TaxID=693979 RepID=E6SUI2_BACT6|nr:ATP-binding protein [Bacteroides helcogenes]ADV43346.1 AAA-ATPase [Bacteroides helcogenes P 36-108]MDY5238114.1 ATP-binding protein [Bacteroides helcogenes]
MELNGRRYPIGIQNFEELRNRNCVYVDKTELVYKLANTDKVYFFSRPRRFGKSLLVSTLEAYFQGKKELFKGLALERWEKDWVDYPVLHIDFSLTKYTTLFDLQEQLNLFLSRWEQLYGKNEQEETPAARLQGIILRAYEKTGKQIVVLIDEYDAPLLDNNSDATLQQQLRNEMRKFFSPLKGLGHYLRFLFITGISKFSQLSIFSELNNLKNISMRDDFSALCGITEQELLAQLEPDIKLMAEANNETYEEACLHLKRQYDGYHFSKACADIYNPFSLFNAFDAKEYKNYWFSTGTPTFLIDILKRSDFDVRSLEGVEATDEQFDAPTEQITSPIPVLYQSGYLTIKGYDPTFQIYRLAYPNGEVRKGFIESLLPAYVHLPGQNNTFYVVSFIRDLLKGDIESCLERTRSFFASIPNDLENKTEKHYQTIFYLLFRLMGQYVDVEVKSAIGRADAVVKLQDAIYVFEFKYDGTPEEALAQIDSKQYDIPYQADGRRIVKVGVNFDSATRTIGEWKVSGNIK